MLTRASCHLFYEEHTAENTEMIRFARKIWPGVEQHIHATEWRALFSLHIPNVAI